MRLLSTAAAPALAAFLALAACNEAAETPAAPVAEQPAAETAAAEDHSGHGAMDHDMAAADTADDANTDETPAGFTFHTYPDKVESVHLPVVAGETWAATVDFPDLVSVGAAADETMPDGTVHHVVKVTPLKSGNAIVTFERRAAPDAAPTESRAIHFMVH